MLSLDTALQASAESSEALGRHQAAQDRLGYDAPRPPIHRDR